MSYFDLPRVTFSGRFRASPSTINNTPNNFDPTIYPSPNELAETELYWNPLGNGEFALDGCTVTRIDYPDGTCATNLSEDPLIGQPVNSVKSASFPLPAAIVDLDPMQQNVSEVWALRVRIGASDGPNLTGDFAAVAFSGIWLQAQGPNAPRSSASGAATYQSTLSNITLKGGAASSRFLRHFEDNPDATMSIVLNVNTHNNAPPTFDFSANAAGDFNKLHGKIPDDIAAKLKPMQKLFEKDTQSKLKLGVTRPIPPVPQSPGIVPTEPFVLFMLKQYLTTKEFNANVQTILDSTRMPYGPAQMSTTENFCYGLLSGCAAPSSKGEPDFFVPSRALLAPVPSPNTGKPNWNVAPFTTSADGKTVVLNLGNSFPTVCPGQTPDPVVCKEVYLVAYPHACNGSLGTPKHLTRLPPVNETMIKERAGMAVLQIPMDCSKTPLGLVNKKDQELLSEN